MRSVLCHPSFLRTYKRGRNINRLPIGFPRPKAWLSLGTPNPPMIVIAEETSDLRRWRFSRHLRLLIPTFSLLNAPAHLTVYLHSNQNAPLPLGDFEKDFGFSGLARVLIQRRVVVPAGLEP